MIYIFIAIFIIILIMIIVNIRVVSQSQAFIIDNKYMAGYPIEAINDDSIHLKYILSKNANITL